MDIYQMELFERLWDISNMAARDKRIEASAGARAIYDSLMRLKPDDLSNNEWTARAGVNSSFFTALRKGSEPSVGNLRRILNAIDLTLSEFFASEAGGRLMLPVSRSRLEAAFEAALPGLPRRNERRSSYLTEVVLAALAPHRIEISSKANPADAENVDEQQEAEAHFATN